MQKIQEKLNVNKYANYILLLTLFITNAISMILELVIARILSPYLGSSNTTWTIIISIMLLANAVGNYYGGKLADKYNVNNITIFLLIISVISIIAIEKLNIHCLNTTIDSTESFIYISIILFIMLLPCICIGVISPFANKLLVKTNIGKESGKIYTVITIGSLIGTLFGGLFLIPRLGCNIVLDILSICMSILLLLNIIVIYKNKKHILYIITCIILSAISIIDIATFKNNISNMLVFDTVDSYVKIYDTTFNNEDITVFSVGGGYESAIYKDKNRQNELVFNYTKLYDIVKDTYIDSKDYLMIGGAGYTYPRHFLSKYKDTNMTVVEIDSKITEIAKEYFGLNDFIKSEDGNRLTLINADGRLYLKNNNKYDVILNDAFSGEVPAKTLATIEAVSQIKDSLTIDGIYASNILGSADTSFLINETKTLNAIFKYVWLIPATDNYINNKILDDTITDKTNFIVIASDYNYNFDTINYNINNGDIYTDDLISVN